LANLEKENTKTLNTKNGLGAAIGSNRVAAEWIKNILICSDKYNRVSAKNSNARNSFGIPNLKFEKGCTKWKTIKIPWPTVCWSWS